MTKLEDDRWVKQATYITCGTIAFCLGMLFVAKLSSLRQKPELLDDSPIPRYNETACQVYLTRTRCRHLTGIIAYHLGHYESTKGHYVTYRIGDRLVREYWMSSEFTVLDEECQN